MTAATLPNAASSPAHARPLAIAVFANEKTVQPSRTINLGWSGVVDLLKLRQHRPHKSGPMLGGYALSGTRADTNIPHRSLIQLDIDSDVVRDKETGRLVAVTRTAPALDDIKPALSGLEWIATSSHSHEPAHGIIKYRVTILPDRDILPDEHKPVLEALDQVLGGCLDRNAWPLSQAFYLPSCPDACAADAFFVHHSGGALPVDDIVARGRRIIAAGQSLSPQLPPVVSRSIAPVPETDANVGTVRAMLAAIPANIDRSEWRKIVWAVCSLSWTCGEQFAREWSMSCPPSHDLWNPKDFNGVWSSYDPNRPDAISFRSLEHIALSHNYAGPLIVSSAQFDGNGADVANGRLFAQAYRNRLLHISETGAWLKFNPRTGWVSAAPLEHETAAKEVYGLLRSDAGRQLAAGAEPDKVRKLMRHVDYTSRVPHLRAMIDMSKSEPGMSRLLSDFDADPALLGVVNGAVDLDRGVLLPSAPDMLVSKRCRVPHDPGATCPRFEQFMGEVQPDPYMRSFLRRWMGYCLTGSVTEQKFAFLYGSGANGKSVLVELLAWILGDYTARIQTDMLMQHNRNPQGPSPDILDLKGVRFAYANETDEGQRLAGARVKDLTGGDTLSAREPYGKSAVSFRPSHKLVLAGNHKPDIADMTDGMWRRVLLVGFDQTIPEAKRDPYLIDKLKAEGAGVLNWMLEGHRQWRQFGLLVPDAVSQATTAYRNEQDILADWLNENCVAAPGLSIRKAELYIDYKAWATVHGHAPMSQTRLTRRLNDRGYQLQGDRRTVKGLAMKTRPLKPT